MIKWEIRVLLKHYLDQGLPKAAIARQLGINRRTINRWIAEGQLKQQATVIEGFEELQAYVQGLPFEISEEQRTSIVGSNVRVSIPLESTTGDVLVVPVAALTAGPGGESRVEVDRGGARTEIVVVETGLSAGGYVEVTGEGLAVGDLVVVGR